MTITPKFPGLGGWVLVACLSVAGCLWAGVGWFVWIWSMWAVQVDMDECFRLSVILINIVYIRSTCMCLIYNLIVFD